MTFAQPEIPSSVEIESDRGPYFGEWLLPVGAHDVTFPAHFMVQEPAHLTVTSDLFSVTASPAELSPDPTASIAVINEFLETCGEVCAIDAADIGAQWSQNDGAVTPIPLNEVVAADGAFTGSYVLLEIEPEPLSEVSLTLNTWSEDGPNSGLVFPTRGYGTMLEITCPAGETCQFDDSQFETSSMRIGKLFLMEIAGEPEVVLVDPTG